MSAPVKVPKTFGACADRLAKIRLEKKPFQDKIDMLDEERKTIEAYLIDNMPKDDTGGVGKQAKAVIITSNEPTVENRAALQKYIRKTGDFSLLLGSLKKDAVKEQWEAGKKIPGVGVFMAIKVSVTKI